MCCFTIAVALQKLLVTALRELHSRRPPPEHVHEFIVAILAEKTPPEFPSVDREEDEGVYEYFKTKGVFGLLKVSSFMFYGSYVARASRVTDEYTIHVCVCVAACANFRRQASPG